MIKCKKCGTVLNDEDLFCPECGTPVEKSEADTKNYWLDKKIWAIFIVLALITVPMHMYLDDMEVKSSNETTTSDSGNGSGISAEAKDGLYSQATNINYLGISSIQNENIYITINQQLVKFNSDYSSQEVVLDGYYTAFSEDENNYYYLDADNNYIKMDKVSRQEDVLLMNVYYVHKIDNLVYYQNDEDNESIHCLDLSSNQDTKINDEVSYCLMVDQKEKRIFYTNLDNELISISLEGKDKQVLGENTSLYTYDGVYLYYLTDQGVMRCNLDGDEKLIYESANLELINMIGDKLIVQEDNTLYQMDRDGKNVEKIYTSITDMTFEVIGEQLLVLSTEDYNQFSYQIVNLDGTSKSLTENQSELIGNEV